jgi:hypothetical protein
MSQIVDNSPNQKKSIHVQKYETKRRKGELVYCNLLKIYLENILNIDNKSIITLEKCIMGDVIKI